MPSAVREQLVIATIAGPAAPVILSFLLPLLIQVPLCLCISCGEHLIRAGIFVYLCSAICLASDNCFTTVGLHLCASSTTVLRTLVIISSGPNHASCHYMKHVQITIIQFTWLSKPRLRRRPFPQQTKTMLATLVSEPSQCPWLFVRSTTR